MLGVFVPDHVPQHGAAVAAVDHTDAVNAVSGAAQLRVDRDLGLKFVLAVEVNSNDPSTHFYTPVFN